jgi:hypothetical protein
MERLSFGRDVDACLGQCSGMSLARQNGRACRNVTRAHCARGLRQRRCARRGAPLALVFVRVKDGGRGRHQPGATGRRCGSLRDSDRKAIGCQPPCLGLDPAVRVDVSTTEPTPERAEWVHGSDSRRVAAGRRSSGPACGNVTRARGAPSGLRVHSPRRHVGAARWTSSGRSFRRESPCEKSPREGTAFPSDRCH